MRSSKRPNFFIVGAAKCGTTALCHYLAKHPDVFVARTEPAFFGADLHLGPQFQLYRRYPEEYFSLFDGWGDQARGGEKSVWYLFSKTAAVEIKAFNPDALIIIMLREPTAMLYSLYHEFLAVGNEHLPTFEEALAAEDDRRAGRRLNRQTFLAQMLVYRETVRFYEQVKRYFDVFGRERVHVIIYDDFSTQTAEVFRKTLAFLGVAYDGIPPEFKVVNGNANGDNSVRSTILRAIMNDRMLRQAAVDLRNWLPYSVFTAMRKTWVKLNEFNFRESPAKRRPMDPELKLSLLREFAPEVERLSELLGRDLTHWSVPGGLTQPESASSALEAGKGALNETSLEAV
jgi:hypothetical protein